MYKNLSSYVDIANSIKPDIDSGYNSKYKTTINTPVDSGVSDFIHASKKLDFRARVEEVQSKNPYDIEFSFDKEDDDEDGRDAFDRFLAGEFAGREYPNINVEDDDTNNVVDMGEIKDYDPETQTHSDWLKSLSDGYRSAVDKKFNDDVESRKNNTKPNEADRDTSDKFDEYVSKHQIPERVYNKMSEVVSAMKNNQKFMAKLDTTLPDGYVHRAIEEFTKRTLPSDDSKLHDMIINYLQSDLKSSRGDVTQLFDIYSK